MLKTCKNYQNVRVSSSKKMRKNHPIVLPLDNFLGKNKYSSSFARRISASRGSFLQSWPLLSGILDKKNSSFKIAILIIGWLSKFQSHKSWGDANISLGQRKRTQLKWDGPKTYKFWQSPNFQNCLSLKIISRLKANSVQLDLPSGTELGKIKYKINFLIKWGHIHPTPCGE